MSQPWGHRFWAVAEGYIPGSSTSPDEMTSHETLCVLNTSDQHARAEITTHFPDREPVGPYRVEIPAGRTLHLGMDDQSGAWPIPEDTEFVMVIRADVPLVIQHTGLDSWQAEDALFSGVALPVPSSGGD